ncbi:MAG: hypothetical protein ING44_14700 [Telmatospirillum sp.]|nr:hypothetical protein [Telmatospirillum sp.]
MIPPPQSDFSEADLVSEYLRRFYAQWLSKRGQRDMPGTAALNANSLRWALGKYTLVDVEGSAAMPRFRYSYCCWEHVQQFGNDLTGTMVEDNPNLEIRALALAAYRLCVAQRKAVLSFRHVRDASLIHFDQALVLPHCGAEGEVARMLVAIDFDT